MRVAVNMPVDSTDKIVKFYVEELALFEISRDYGMSTVLISYKGDSDFGIMLSETEDSSSLGNLFLELEVENCKNTFIALRKSLSQSKGYIYAKDLGNPEIFEYPVGKNFMVIDPLGNKILMFEDFEPLKSYKNNLG